MTRQVQVAVAGSVTEAEELQSILAAAGIESELDLPESTTPRRSTIRRSASSSPRTTSRTRATRSRRSPSRTSSSTMREPDFDARAARTTSCGRRTMRGGSGSRPSSASGTCAGGACSMSAAVRGRAAALAERASQGLGRRAERRDAGRGSRPSAGSAGCAPAALRSCRSGTGGSTASCSSSSSTSSIGRSPSRRPRACWRRRAARRRDVRARALRHVLGGAFFPSIAAIDGAVSDGGAARSRARRRRLPTVQSERLSSRHTITVRRTRADPWTPHLDVRSARSRRASQRHRTGCAGAAGRGRGAFGATRHSWHKNGSPLARMSVRARPPEAAPAPRRRGA